MIFHQKNRKRQFLLGVNYWPSTSALHMWTEWDPAEIRVDIRQMMDLGMNCCRFFLFMPAFMDNPQGVNHLMMERLHLFLQECESQKLQTLPTFIVGHMSGEDWDVEWCRDKNFITDSAVIMITKTYIRSVVREVKSYSCITGWLLSNELPNFIGRQNPGDVEHWVREMCTTIRDEDPERPVSIGDGAWSPEITGEQSAFILRKLNEYQDFVGLHYYSRGMSPWQHAYTTAFRLRLAREWGRPVIVEEFGASTTLCSEQNQACYYREVFYSALINGADGVLSWCLNDFDFQDKRPYSHHAYEERFGIVRTDKSWKPAASEYVPFAQVVQEIAEGNYHKVEQPAGLLIPANYYYEYPYQFQPEFKEWYSLYLEVFSLLKRGNVDVKMVYEPAQELEHEGRYSHSLSLNSEEIPVLFVPRMKVMSKPMRVQLEQYVHDGGTLYFSFANDSWVLDWHKLAGIEMDCKFGVPDFPEGDSITIQVEDSWGEFQQGDKFNIPLTKSTPGFSYCPVVASRAETVMSDKGSSPFLTKHSIGKGTVYFCAFPVEMLALNDPLGTWQYSISRIYRSIFKNAGKPVLFEVNGDGLEMGVWKSDDGFLVYIFNHSWERQKGTLTVRLSDWDIRQASLSYRQLKSRVIEFALDRKSVCHFSIMKH